MKSVKESPRSKFLKRLLDRVWPGLIIPFLIYLVKWAIDNITPPLRFHEIIDALIIVVAELSFLFLLIVDPSKGKINSSPRKRGRLFILLCCNMLLLRLSWVAIGPLISEFFTYTDIDKLVHGHHWIVYDPFRFDPNRLPNPEVDSMRKDLGCINDAGFDGIITLSSNGTLSEIPELAKERGQLVIMGIWDPRDKQEVAAGISKKKFVDGYCIGHNGLGWRYEYGDLVEAIRYVRWQTDRPVSTTELFSWYLADDNLLIMGDWIFPDSHVDVRNDRGEFVADGFRDAKTTVKWAISLASQKGRRGKPILLKMVCYPMNGIANASREQQARFYKTILESRGDALEGWPSGVSLAVGSTFDLPWKSIGAFYPWDPYTGLFEDTCTPRPAVKEIIRRMQ